MPFLLCISLCFTLVILRVKPAIFDLLLAVCIAAYLGMMYLAIQVGHCVHAVICQHFHTFTHPIKDMYAIGRYYLFKGELCRFGKQNSNSEFKYLQGNEVIIQNWLLFP